MRKTMMAVLSVAVIGMAAGCNVRAVRVEQEKALAERAVGRFQAAYNTGNLDYLYAIMHEPMKASLPKADVTAAINATRESMGAHQEGTLVFSQVYPTASPLEIRQIYNSLFEKGGKQTEFFIWVSDGRDVRLLNHRVAEGWVDPATLDEATK